MKEWRKCKTDDEAFELQQQHLIGKPRGRIQWKGTQVCIDITCGCGHHMHFDEEFLYSIQCRECKRYWALNQTVELIEVEEKPDGGLYTLDEGGSSISVE